MKSKPNINVFLDGGAGDLADKTHQQSIADGEWGAQGKVHKEQKVFRLPLDLINELKKEAYERSMKTGLRVTETELVEKALRAFFNI